MSSPQVSGGNGDTPQALRSWWSTFKKGKRKTVPAVEVQAPQGIFGVPLKDSIQYANVAISLLDDQGKSFIYGYVPIVVAKCGVFLKEKATDVEGIFRLSGSAKRIKELQALFDSPPRYGKGLDWNGYTVHDAANVFRRYLNQLPQPIVPLEFYEKFRVPLRGHQSQAVGNNEAQTPVATTDFDHDKAIATYQELITQLPPLNRQLLLYILDLLSVFAFKADINRMTAANLAAIFQPGMLSHPDHDMMPPEYRLSQDVIIFLIDNQDSFLIGMSGTAADEKTVREVQAGPQPTTPSKASGLGRSVSNASGGADSARKLGIRRNVSVSSKNSKHSSTAQTPVTPQSGGFSGTVGVHRSNTVPSKRSPALSSTRGGHGIDSPTASVALSPAVIPLESTPTKSSNVPPATPTVLPVTPTVNEPTIATPTADQTESSTQNERNLTVGGNLPKGAKRASGILKQAPTSDAKDLRQPNKLKKKRDPTKSTNSSTNSLSGADYIDGLPMPKDTSLPIAGNAPRVGEGLEESMGPSTLHSSRQPSVNTSRGKSPVASLHSKASAPDTTEQSLNEPVKAEEPEKKRWRFSSIPNKDAAKDKAAEPTLAQGSNKAAAKSSGSIGSAIKPRDSNSNSNDFTTSVLEPVASEQTQPTGSSVASKDTDEPEQKKGLFGRIKARVEKSREEHRAKEAEKERAKSPPRDAERSGSKHSISAIAHDMLPSRGRTSEADGMKAADVGGKPVVDENTTQKKFTDPQTADENVAFREQATDREESHEIATPTALESKKAEVPSADQTVTEGHVPAPKTEPADASEATEEAKAAPTEGAVEKSSETLDGGPGTLPLEQTTMSPPEVVPEAPNTTA